VDQYYLYSEAANFWLPTWYFQRKPYFQPPFVIPYTDHELVVVDSDGVVVQNAVLEAGTGAVYIPGVT